jgi:hypothetical protein
MKALNSKKVEKIMELATIDIVNQITDVILETEATREELARELAVTILQKYLNFEITS